MPGVLLAQAGIQHFSSRWSACYNNYDCPLLHQLTAYYLQFLCINVYNMYVYEGYLQVVDIATRTCWTVWLHSGEV